VINLLELSMTQTLLNNRSSPAAGEKHGIPYPVSIHHSDREGEKHIDVYGLILDMGSHWYI